ncbi:G3E family GTPase [Haloferula luteola]|uniref:G3E family GTPase n=1 Tax=Haloferula luteola TaxID=595692 RepID=A0A840V6B3_9BACT|nr:GTP-binding protein [Haloferula luteola]MBB5350318.1 G3E family GTPase [Haloferula luteola]
MNPSPAPLPVLITAGFLGSGKTTLIRELLPQLATGSRKPFVLLNDYLNAEIDASSLRGLGAEILTLPASCVCCDDSAGLIDAILKIPTDPPALLMIEANGTTDPYRLIEVLTLTRSLRQRLGPIHQVTVLNESRFGKRLLPGDKRLEQAQVRTASAILTNRSERASPAQRQRVREALMELNPRAPVLHLEAFANLLVEETPLLSPDLTDPPEHVHHHVAVRFPLPRMTIERLRTWLLMLPRDVQRSKGVVQISQEEICYFQRTDDPFESPNLHTSLIPDGFESTAVFIGHGLQESSLRATLESPAFKIFSLSP